MQGGCMPTARRVISADSHTWEPADLWTSRLDKDLRDIAPRVLANEGRPGYSFHAPGMTPTHVSGTSGAGLSGEDLKKHLENANYLAARPSGWDPAERMKDMALDGVEAEVLYGTLVMRLYPMKDGRLQRAFFAAYNDWLADYCAYDPKHLHGLGCVSLWDVDSGVEELQRCAERDFKGAMIWASPPADRPYHSKLYDPLWAAAQDLHLPLSLHIVTGMGEESRVDMTDVSIRYMHMIHEVQRSLSTLVLGGVLERFPQLMIVFAECEVGWLPHWMQRMDHAQHKFGAMMDTKLTMTPSEYIRRQVWLTFLDDPVGAASYEAVGQDTFMWGSDFPHTDSTWPNSRSVIARNFDSVPDSIATKILHDNAAKLYHIDLG